MNKQLQRWLDRPGWQLYLYQWGVLGLMGLGVYSMLLRPQWQQQQLSTQEIIQHQQQVERQQSELALFPSLFSLQQELTALSVAEASRQQPGGSIAHLVGKWIGPFGGHVISWQRQSEPLVGGGGAGLVEQQQWAATLRINFYGLRHLLRQLATTPSPIQIQLIDITRDNHALTVKLTLQEYLAGGGSELSP
ncbi:pilus assembly protein PilO [Yersinia enterocolitica]|uniref:pilus assembly protein PilO n=1 Tax=Yersinia enterocolitica TaxID=630 RepID=UPI0021E8DEE7|nr:pilus assembly protein PilO [Yersinia enterocolitica]EKN3338007.1 pilus assembly protein PilO [Yersinia enterocolitica]EKN3460439.1 pilus assembly protein PilO [Yersinia enterocolitica]EKN3500696.1 pilus assembly protein PilO [Yersinia enterocolitica]EKN3972159.1 pilus assembly protein PilO [Yersinia enterocolitica]EKN4004994.1 pilus assembly protein PilO [Yersinia enterocolitica]